MLSDDEGHLLFSHEHVAHSFHFLLQLRERVLVVRRSALREGRSEGGRDGGKGLVCNENVSRSFLFLFLPPSLPPSLPPYPQPPLLRCESLLPRERCRQHKQPSRGQHALPPSLLPSAPPCDQVKGGAWVRKTAKDVREKDGIVSAWEGGREGGRKGGREGQRGDTGHSQAGRRPLWLGGVREGVREGEGATVRRRVGGGRKGGREGGKGSPRIFCGNARASPTANETRSLSTPSGTAATQERNISPSFFSS